MQKLLNVNMMELCKVTEKAGIDCNVTTKIYMNIKRIGQLLYEDYNKYYTDINLIDAYPIICKISRYTNIDFKTVAFVFASVQEQLIYLRDFSIDMTVSERVSDMSKDERTKLCGILRHLSIPGYSQEINIAYIFTKYEKDEIISYLINQYSKTEAENLYEYIKHGKQSDLEVPKDDVKEETAKDRLHKLYPIFVKQLYETLFMNDHIVNFESKDLPDILKKDYVTELFRYHFGNHYNSIIEYILGGVKFEEKLFKKTENCIKKDKSEESKVYSKKSKELDYDRKIMFDEFQNEDDLSATYATKELNEYLNRKYEEYQENKLKDSSQKEKVSDKSDINLFIDDLIDHVYSDPVYIATKKFFDRIEKRIRERENK